jgi:hypothetical protein
MLQNLMSEAGYTPYLGLLATVTPWAATRAKSPC